SLTLLPPLVIAGRYPSTRSTAARCAGVTASCPCAPRSRARRSDERDADDEHREHHQQRAEPPPAHLLAPLLHRPAPCLAALALFLIEHRRSRLPAAVLPFV